MLFTVWTEDPALAAAAARAGVARIGPDLETLGKRDRQPDGDNRIADIHPSTLPALRTVIGNARLHVRSNPLHRGLAQELEDCFDAGVTSVMLPMVRSVDAARQVIAMVRGRAEIIVMVEHADALPIADELAALDGVAELYVGANDLARSLGLPSRFSVLGSDADRDRRGSRASARARLRLLRHRASRRRKPAGAGRPGLRGTSAARCHQFHSGAILRRDAAEHFSRARPCEGAPRNLAIMHGSGARDGRGRIAAPLRCGVARSVGPSRGMKAG